MELSKTTRCLGALLTIFLLPFTGFAADAAAYQIVAVNLSAAPVSIRSGEGAEVWESGVIAPGAVSNKRGAMVAPDFLIWKKTDSSAWQTLRNKDGKAIRYKAEPGSIHVVLISATGVELRSVRAPTGSGPAVSIFNAGSLPVSVQLGSGWNLGTIVNITGLGPGEQSRFASLTREASCGVFWTDSALPSGLASWTLKDKDGLDFDTKLAMAKAYLIIVGLPGRPSLSQPARNGLFIDLGTY